MLLANGPELQKQVAYRRLLLLCYHDATTGIRSPWSRLGLG